MAPILKAKPAPGYVPPPPAAPTPAPLPQIQAPQQQAQQPPTGLPPAGVGIAPPSPVLTFPTVNQFQTGGSFGPPSQLSTLPALGLDPATNRSLGIPDNVQPIVAQVASRYAHPHGLLHWASVVLSAPENLLVGTVQGIGQGIEQGLAPWEYLKAIGHNFSEVGDPNYAMKTIAGDIKAAHFMPQWVRNNANWIALGISTVTDPTMYMSFGVGTASKFEAMGTLVAAYMKSMDKAAVIMAHGGIDKATGRVFQDVYDALSYVHQQDGLPFTLGDALTNLRTTSKAYKAEARAGQHGIFEQAQALAFPGAARGGRGVRFAGMEIPGTVKVGEKVGTLAKGQIETFARKGTIIGDAGLAMVPNSALRAIASDAVRGIGMAEFTRYKNELGRIASAAKQTPRTFLRPMDQKGAAEANVLGHDPGEILIGSKERAGLHQVDYMGPVTPEGQKLMQRINRTVQNEVRNATAAGIPEHDTNNLWNHLREQYPDPVDALAHFRYRNQSRVLTKNFIRSLLKNPFFAKELSVEEGVATIGQKQKYLHDTKAVPAGYRTMMNDGKQYAVLHGIHDALDDMKNTGMIDHETSRALKLLNYPQNWWKIWATVPNMSFHVMNTVGAIWNNFLASPAIGPGDYLAAAMTVLADRLQGTKLEKFGPALTPARAELMRAAEERQGLGKGFFGAELQGIGHEFDIEHLKEGSFKKRLVTPGAGQSKKGLARTRIRQLGVGPAAMSLGSPVLGAVVYAPELARAGRALAGTIEDVVRLAPFRHYANDPTLIRILEAYGPIRVPNLKYLPGLSKANQAALWDIGATVSKHFQFDYTELTKFERVFAKTIFPFYTYTKKNFLLQANQLARQPRNIEAFEKMKNYMNDYAPGAVPEPWKAVLPAYFDQLEAFRLPVPAFMRHSLGLPLNEPLYLNPKLPFIQLDLFPEIWQVFQDTGEPTSQKIIRAMSPIAGMIGPFAAAPIPGAKIMLEAALNQQLGLGRRIDYQRGQSNDYRQSFVDAPGWSKYLPHEIQSWFGIFHDPHTGSLKTTATGSYVMQQLSSPFLTNLGTSVPVGSSTADTGKARANLISWMTGLRLMPVDMLKLSRANAYDLTAMLGSQKQEAKARGIPFDPNDARTLMLVRAQSKVLNAYWHQREMELGYGSPVPVG